MPNRQPSWPEETEDIDDNPRKVVGIQQNSGEKEQQERMGEDRRWTVQFVREECEDRILGHFLGNRLELAVAPNEWMGRSG